MGSNVVDPPIRGDPAVCYLLTAMATSVWEQEELLEKAMACCSQYSVDPQEIDRLLMLAGIKSADFDLEEGGMGMFGDEEDY